MKVYLCLPHPVARTPTRLLLTWTTEHSASSHGLGVLLDAYGVPFDGAAFRRLRDEAGAWLQAPDLDRVRGALGLPPGEPLDPRA